MTRLSTVCTPTSNVWEWPILPNIVSKWCIPGEAHVLVTILQMKKWCSEMLRHFSDVIGPTRTWILYLTLKPLSWSCRSRQRCDFCVPNAHSLLSCLPSHVCLSFPFHIWSFRLRRVCKTVQVFNSDCDFNLAYWIQSKVSTKILGSVMSVKGW